MNEYNKFQMPQTTIYGCGSFEQIGKEAAQRGKKALIVSDAVMNKLGYVDTCRKQLKEAGIESVIFLGVESEPTDQYVAEALLMLEKEACDVIVSLGGGSCIDTAKAVAVLAENGGYIGEYRGASKIADQAPLPHIAVPTTAGTGSEATDVTVITNTSNDVKMMIKQPAFMPSVALVDPSLSMSSPPKITAATGVDALTHAIEAYISKKAHPMSDMYALEAMKLIIPNLERAYQNGSDLEAREAMALGSMYAGAAFSNASVCLVHGMSRPIGALFHVPHGISNAMLLPAVLEYSKEACTERLAHIAAIFDQSAVEMTTVEAAELTVERVKQLCDSLDIPNLQGWGIDKNRFESVIEKMAVDALDSGSPGNNPRVPDERGIQELYRTCFSYQFSL
ncbi:iron-containing alcohol dehydrogenase [Domibacillus robiginosus]|uniref:iron-containing alcohol dehydrogenase n=1 Tax=Domibacillus robiginosus TaxID=1071054 RepID=UPI000A60D959|nr:iron-containing alcohol dehydrogenase [Domibacillus robiginosus]